MVIRGRQTIRELLLATIPARLYFVMAVLAIFVAIGMTLVAATGHYLADNYTTGLAFKIANRLAIEASNYAATFRAMPLWFFIGGSLAQFATRLNTAIDHFIEWRKTWTSQSCS